MSEIVWGKTVAHSSNQYVYISRTVEDDEKVLFEEAIDTPLVGGDLKATFSNQLVLSSAIVACEGIICINQVSNDLPGRVGYV
jgi:hypothetical protein